MKIGIHKAKYKNSQWYHYLIPKRLTLDCNPPIFKWLFWCFELNKKEYQEYLYKKKKQTCFVYCPKCDTELISSNSLVKDTDYVYFKCKHCGKESKWDFDFSCPMLIKEDKQ